MKDNMKSVMEEHADTMQMVKALSDDEIRSIQLETAARVIALMQKQEAGQSAAVMGA